MKEEFEKTAKKHTKMYIVILLSLILGTIILFNGTNSNNEIKTINTMIYAVGIFCIVYAILQFINIMIDISVEKRITLIYEQAELNLEEEKKDTEYELVLGDMEVNLFDKDENGNTIISEEAKKLLANGLEK
jgi:energy-converting hydrogenase Eha subunit E